MKKTQPVSEMCPEKSWTMDNIRNINEKAAAFFN
jgi:hypothetical protein